MASAVEEIEAAEPPEEQRDVNFCESVFRLSSNATIDALTDDGPAYIMPSQRVEPRHVARKPTGSLGA